MPDVKPVTVFAVRLPLAASGMQVVGRAEFMLDSRVDRTLLVAILKHAIAVIEGGRSPDEIARLKL
jgi:hypothetical protein